MIIFYYFIFNLFSFVFSIAGNDFNAIQSEDKTRKDPNCDVYDSVQNKCIKEAENIKNRECTPLTYVIKDCNVCKCNMNGEIDDNSCTKNECTKPVIRRKADNVIGKCDSGNWYSLGPCQFCYCVSSNRLVCSTGNTKSLQSIELGSYHLSICGKELIKNVIELVPEGQEALRNGLLNIPSVKTTTTPKEPPIPPNLYHKSTIPAELYNTITEATVDDDSESSTEEVNKKVRSKKAGREGRSYHAEIREDQDSSDESKEPALKGAVNGQLPSAVFNQDIVKQLNKGVSSPNIMMPVTTTQDPDVLRIHLPSMIDKLLKITLRKNN